MDRLITENARLENERAEWQKTAEAYADHAGRRYRLLERIGAACARALAGDHDKRSMLATLELCAELAAARAASAPKCPAPTPRRRK